MRTGPVGYLPQDPRTGDLDVLAKNRICLPAGWTRSLIGCSGPSWRWVMTQPMFGTRRWHRTREQRPSWRPRWLCRGSGGGPNRQQSRVARASAAPAAGDLVGRSAQTNRARRILFSGAPTLLLDEPTNHLDADSIVWLRDFLAGHSGGLLVITHDVGLLERCVNKVFHLDANRAELDIYTMGWKRYLQQRETDEKRRRRERLNAERKADQLFSQADRMRAKATKAMAAHNMVRRAERLLAGIDGERARDPVAKIKFPDLAPAARRRSPRPTSARATDRRGLHRHRSCHR